MAKTKNGGYMTMKISHLNARLFNRLLNEDGRALYNAEQGKILSSLWDKHPLTATQLVKSTGLAKSSLSIMLTRLEKQGLIICTPDEIDKRKKVYDLTKLGKSQQEVGDHISKKLSEIYYDGFTDEEINEVENYLLRIYENLNDGLNK